MTSKTLGLNGPAVHAVDADYLQRCAQTDYPDELTLRVAFLVGAFRRCAGMELPSVVRDAESRDACLSGYRVAGAWMASPEREMAHALFAVNMRAARELADVREIAKVAS